MGFRNGTKPGADNRKGHRWINYPNNAHRKCTKCGCMVDMTSSKGKMFMCIQTIKVTNRQNALTVFDYGSKERNNNRWGAA